jgi:hypothetical protein
VHRLTALPQTPLARRAQAIRICARTCALLAALGVQLLPARVAHAQVPVRADSAARARADSAAKDSLAARLAKAEADIALLREQMATESATQVRLRSRVRLDLQARILTNTFLTTADANNVEIPLFAQPSLAPGGEYGGAGGKALGLSVRQTTMGASVSIDSVMGATFSADFEIDFFGGANNADGPPLFPPPRLRTARGFLHWTRTELMVGADTPLISDLDPVSTSAIAIPDFTTAGNLWNWLPQIRLTREIARTSVKGSVLHWAVQGALLNPFSGDRHLQETGGVDAGLRSARPYVQGRLRARWGTDHEATTSQHLSDRGGEIGVGGHRGWLRVSGDTLTSSWAVSTDARIGLSHGLELRAEGYRGRLVRGLGGGRHWPELRAVRRSQREGRAVDGYRRMAATQCAGASNRDDWCGLWHRSRRERATCPAA